MEISIIVLLFVVFILFKLRIRKYSYDRELKKCESPIEEILFKKLYETGFKPYTQVSCGKFRIDIAVFHKGKKIAIECDGQQYHSSPEQKEHDRKKDLYLQKDRWNVYRFSGKEIYNDAAWCVEVIKKT